MSIPLLLAMNRDETVHNAYFVDAHVHIRDVSGLDAVLAAGVQAVRDSGSRENAREGNRLAMVAEAGPVIVSARWAIYKKGGYGAFFGVAVESREEIKAEIRKLRSAGAGIIKVMASGMVSLKDPGAVTPGGFGPEDLRFIVEEAAQLGLSVMAHANGEAAILNAVEAGVRSVEHGFFMTREALASMKAHNVFWVPTVGALVRAANAPGVTQSARDFVAATVRSHLNMVHQAFSTGVSLAIGTDCTLPDPHYREAYEAELAYFRQAGIPDAAVMKIATQGGRELLGISIAGSRCK
jgi:imidazolonepropionase-like amidohydrolase